MPSIKEQTTDQRIIKAAVKLFSDLGFTGSCTQEIARLAGVNEITVFRHFPRKRDLFWAAIESELGRLQLSNKLLRQLEADENPHAVLPEIVSLLVHRVRRQPQTARLLYASLFELDHDAEPIMRSHLAPFFQPIREYLLRCARKGLVHDVEPNVALLGLASIVVTHERLEQLLIPLVIRHKTTDDAIHAYTTFWMKALVPDSASMSTVIANSTSESIQY